MPNKTFLDFQQKTELASGDYIVGYKVDGTAEFRAALSDLAQYVFDYTVPTYSLEAGSASADEGTSVTFTLSTAFVRNGTVVPYTITGISAADLESGALTGNFVVNNNTASQVIALSADQFTEGTETLILTLDGITPTVSAALVINDTSVSIVPTYSAYFTDYTSSTPITAVNEGAASGSVMFRVDATNPVLPISYTITGISQEDIDVPLTGVLEQIPDNYFYLGNFSIFADNLTEGPETMVVTLDGITPTVSAALVINDTSTTPVSVPTYNLYITDNSSVPITEINEYETLIIKLDTTNVAEGTEIPYTITGITQSDIDDADVFLTGTLTIDFAGQASLPFTPALDMLTEGPETMVVTLDGITPTVSAALVINDTSTTP